MSLNKTAASERQHPSIKGVAGDGCDSGGHREQSESAAERSSHAHIKPPGACLAAFRNRALPLPRSSRGLLGGTAGTAAIKALTLLSAIAEANGRQDQ